MSRGLPSLAASFAGIGFGNGGVHLCHAIRSVAIFRSLLRLGSDGTLPSSYPISGLNKTGPKYRHPGYVVEKPIIPHGIRSAFWAPASLRSLKLNEGPSHSVALTGPAVFKFTAPSSPDRHRLALSIFAGVSETDSSIARLPDNQIGEKLYDEIAKFLDGLGVPRGLKAVGYGAGDVERLVQGTLPQVSSDITALILQF